MKQIFDWNSVSEITEREKLPVGAYICKILAAKVVQHDGQNGKYENLEIAFDITEGDYKNFFYNDYEIRKQFKSDAKWSGVMRLTIPDGNSSDNKVIWAQRRFKTAISAIENSNEGYHWDWNEKALRDLYVGVIFREEEWEWDGKSGVSVKPYSFCTPEYIMQGKVKIPSRKLLEKNKADEAAADNILQELQDIDDDELPF